MQPHDLIDSLDEHTFARFRNATLDTLYWGRRRHHIPMMLELDVTVARDALRTQNAQTGKGITYWWTGSPVARWKRRARDLIDPRRRQHGQRGLACISKS